jgi:imidazolonepropionase
VVPAEHADDPDAYVDLVCGPMLDACAPLARWCDVFCDRGAFDDAQARRVLMAGRDRGLGLRVHANQLEHGPGARLAAELGAASADHLTHLADEDREALAAAGVVATLLPIAELSTRSPWPDARALLDAGVTVALATDCNPGTSFSTSMPLVIALAVTAMGMTPEEAVWSATAGGAAALRRDDIGRLAPGARADLLVLDAPSGVHLAYRPGVPLVQTVIRGGEVVVG